MPIKSFRGLIADGVQDTIHLHTIDGSTGYRIIKFQVMAEKPGDVGQESLVQIWKVDQTTTPTAAGTVDFSDQTLLGAVVGIFGVGEGLPTPVFFDNEIFNQDIYITHTDNKNAERINYYIELEQVKLDLNENTVATLKDIRNIAAQ